MKPLAWRYVVPSDKPTRSDRLRARVGYTQAVKLLQQRPMRPSRTRQEKIFKSWLVEAGEIFEDQVPLWGKYILDFLLPTRRLIVEVDGMHHYSASTADYDDGRTADLRTVGKVLRLSNAMICEERKDEVLRLIREHVEYNAVYPDRLCWRVWASKRAEFNEKEISRILKAERASGEIGRRLVAYKDPGRQYKRKLSQTVESVLGPSIHLMDLAEGI